MENEIIKLIWRPKRVRNRNQFGHDVGSRASANFGWKKKKKGRGGKESNTKFIPDLSRRFCTRRRRPSRWLRGRGRTRVVPRKKITDGTRWMLEPNGLDHPSLFFSFFPSFVLFVRNPPLRIVRNVVRARDPPTHLPWARWGSNRKRILFIPAASRE